MSKHDTVKKTITEQNILQKIKQELNSLRDKTSGSQAKKQKQNKKQKVKEKKSYYK